MPEIKDAGKPPEKKDAEKRRRKRKTPKKRRRIISQAGQLQREMPLQLAGAKDANKYAEQERRRKKDAEKERHRKKDTEKERRRKKTPKKKDTEERRPGLKDGRPGKDEKLVWLAGGSPFWIHF